MSHDILEGIELKSPEVKEALMISAIRLLADEVRQTRRALYSTAGAIIVAVLIQLLLRVAQL